jgi:uncharacterized membrane protein
MITIPEKYHSAAVIVGFLAVGACLYFFWSHILQIILGLFGLGAAVVASKQDKAEKAIAIADEHENLADARIIQSVNELKQAETAHDKAVEIAEKDDDTTPIPVKSGGVRRSFKSQ